MASNQSGNLYMEIQDEAVRTVEDADDRAEEESAEPPDAEPPDAEPLDAEPPDAEPPDAEPPDAEPPDAQLPDAEPPDAEPPDAEQNMGEPFYWEIPDEPAPLAEGPPRPCLRRVPEGYLAPREPDAENEETESSQRLLPLYENSRIRHCSPRTLPGNSSRCTTTRVKAEVTVHADKPACSGTNKTASDDYLTPAPEREVLGAQGRNADEDLTLASMHSRTERTMRSAAQGSASTDQSTIPLGHRGAPLTEEQGPLGSLLYLTPAPPRKHTEGKQSTSDDIISGASSEAGLLGEQQRNSHEDLPSGSLDPSLHEPDDYLTPVPPRKHTEGQQPTSDAITIDTSSEAGPLGEQERNSYLTPAFLGCRVRAPDDHLTPGIKQNRTERQQATSDDIATEAYLRPEAEVSGVHGRIADEDLTPESLSPLCDYLTPVAPRGEETVESDVAGDESVISSQHGNNSSDASAHAEEGEESTISHHEFDP